MNNQKPDKYGRLWPAIPDRERCGHCGQPDNCGDCTCGPLSDEDVTLLGGINPPRCVWILTHRHEDGIDLYPFCAESSLIEFMLGKARRIAECAERWERADLNTLDAAMASAADDPLGTADAVVKLFNAVEQDIDGSNFIDWAEYEIRG